MMMNEKKKTLMLLDDEHDSEECFQHEEILKKRYKRLLQMALAVFTICIVFMRSNVSIKSKSFNLSLHKDRILRVQNPKIAWLISFPQSSDVELMYLVQAISSTTTASNYGNFLINDHGTLIRREGDSVPAYVNKFGPSKTSNLPLPEKYLLTSTHGYGTCLSCPPWKYMGFSAQRQHMHANTWATKLKNGAFVPYKYDIGLVKKMVILYRDPLDVVVSRFLQHAEPEEKNKDGFIKYCHNQDHDEFFGPKQNWFRQANIYDLSTKVPCNAEFVKIFTFYNMVEKVRERFELETHYVSTKEIADHTTHSMYKLLSFLELPSLNPIPPKMQGSGEGDYFNFYSDDQRQAIAELGYEITVPEVWGKFEPFLKKYREVNVYSDDGHDDFVDLFDYIL